MFFLCFNLLFFFLSLCRGERTPFTPLPWDTCYAWVCGGVMHNTNMQSETRYVNYIFAQKIRAQCARRVEYKKKKKQCFSLSAVHGWEVIRWSLVQFQLLYFINTRRTGWTCFFITDGEQSSTIRLVGIDSVVFHPNYHSMERPIIIIHQIIFIICVWVDHERAPSTVTQHQHTNGSTLRKIEK